MIYMLVLYVVNPKQARVDNEMFVRNGSNFSGSSRRFSDMLTGILMVQTVKETL